MKPVEETVEQEFVNTTPKGSKKDLSGAFPTTYKAKPVEAAWYDWWEKCGFFQPQLNKDGLPRSEGTYVIPIPPPNITGSLHLGHAMFSSIQDCMVRWNRMKGKTTLWVPGCDHASIATQVVVEKKLMRERNLTRHQLGRDKFILEAYKWKESKEHEIYNQIRRLGSSFDWTRTHFTMDPDLCEAVKHAFVTLFDDGTIYRSNRFVTWCTKLKTALSNLEVENMELEGRTLLSVPDHDPSKKYEFGVLISFAYQVENSDEKIVVATTRLETMLGDTAVAVHPSDKRYQHLHGKYVIHPFQNRRIPIVADEYPDPEFGTGAVKITPAHDQNDFMVAKRNNLESINIFTDDGKINENGAPFTNLQRFDARIAVLEALKEKGLYVKTEDNKMQLPICTRSNNIVEYLMKPQWYVNCQQMASDACQVVRKGELQIIPASSEKEWFRWLEEPQDWCISRQLWWGHRIPAYYVEIEGEPDDRDSMDRWVSAVSDKEALEKATKKFGDSKKITVHQDEDVLDTWFSSGLWPFSIMGWPNKTKDMDFYFPNTLLETGWDILFFWVARMVMLSIKLTGKAPFKQVFCHAMVRDAHGRKMSKTLGNVIDPIDVIEGISLDALQKKLETGNLDPSELQKAKDGQRKDFPNGISECGTDALRFALLAYTSTNRDINLDILRIEGYSKFCNKIWNAVRFGLMKLGNYVPPAKPVLTGDESLVDLWILSKLHKAVLETNTNLEQLNFMQATNVVYQFWLYELCDVYLEVCKPIIDGSDEAAKKSAKDTLYLCIEKGLQLLHPMMPFVTEELYQRLVRRPGDECKSIMVSRYPEPEESWNNAKAEQDFEFVNTIARASRSIITDYNVRNNITLYVQTESSELITILEKQKLVIQNLIRGVKELNILDKDNKVPEGCAVTTLQNCSIYLLVKGQVDVEAEVQKIASKIEKLEKQFNNLKKLTETDGYIENVKQEVKNQDLSKLQLYEKDLTVLRESMETFKRL